MGYPQYNLTCHRHSSRSSSEQSEPEKYSWSDSLWGHEEKSSLHVSFLFRNSRIFNIELISMKKLYLANSLLLFDFWMTVSIPFMVFRGISLDGAVGLISIYIIFATILEYPTGVIGDYFGHKISVVIGTACAVVSYMMLFWANNYIFFLLALLVRALAMTLRSGSTEALLKSYSSSIKKDYSNFSAIEDIMMFLASIMAGFIAEFSLSLAVAINIITTALSLAVIITIKDNKEAKKIEGNVFALANQGMTEVIKSSRLLIPIVLLMFFYSYGRNVKSIFGIMSETYDIRLSYLGVFIGLGMLVRSIGRYLYGKYKNINMNMIVILFLITLFTIGLTSNYWVIVFLILCGNILMGFLLSWLKLGIMENASDNTRASVLSFSGLLGTLSGSMYLFLFGKISVTYSITFAIAITSVFLSVIYALSKLNKFNSLEKSR